MRRPLRLFGLLLGCLSGLSGCCAGFPLLFFLTVKIIKPGTSFIPDCCNQLSRFGLLKGGVKHALIVFGDNLLHACKVKAASSLVEDAGFIIQIPFKNAMFVAIPGNPVAKQLYKAVFRYDIVAVCKDSIFCK